MIEKMENYTLYTYISTLCQHFRAVEKFEIELLYIYINITIGRIVWVVYFEIFEKS